MNEFSRQGARVIRLSQRQQHALCVARDNRIARKEFEQKLARDERFARERGMRAAAVYIHKIDSEREKALTWWEWCMASVSAALFLWLWGLWS